MCKLLLDGTLEVDATSWPSRRIPAFGFLFFPTVSLLAHMLLYDYQMGDAPFFEGHSQQF